MFRYVMFRVFLCCTVVASLLSTPRCFSEDSGYGDNKDVFHLNKAVLEIIVDLNMISKSIRSDTYEYELRAEHYAMVDGCISRLDSGDVRQLQLFVALLEQSMRSSDLREGDRYWHDVYRHAAGQAQRMLADMASDEARNALLELKRQFGQDGGASLHYNMLLVRHEVGRGMPFGEAYRIYPY